MYKALCALVELCKKHNIKLRQSYLRVCKKALMMSGRYRHAKQMKRAKGQEQFIRVRLGRVIRNIRRKIAGNSGLIEIFNPSLNRASTIRHQQRHSKDKIYSWHAPEVECIGKGKAAKPYEFGCKVSVMTSINSAPRGHFVLHISALHGRPFDGHTLKPVLESYEKMTGIKPERVYVDRGYKGHDYQPKNCVYKSGQKRGVVGVIKRELRKRPLVEPIIGHLKTDHHLGRNYLQGKAGDKINAILSGVGYNFRLLLKWLRFLFGQNWERVYSIVLSISQHSINECRLEKSSACFEAAF